MKFWWLVDSQRFGREKHSVEALVSEGWFDFSRWAVVDARLVAYGTIKAKGADYPVKLTYPDQFPAVPAIVQPQDPEAKWSNHQYGAGGSLCLELRPDNWVQSATGADMLRSAYNLLYTENPKGTGEKGEVPSAGHLRDIEFYSWFGAVLIGAGCEKRIRAREASEVQAFRWLAYDDNSPVYVCDGADRAVVGRALALDLPSWRIQLPVHVAFAPFPSSTPSDRHSLVVAAGLDAEAAGKTSEGALFILFVNDAGLRVYESKDAASVKLHLVEVLPDDGGKRSGRSLAAAGKSVTIVGAGSVGSKLAESLLRSGIHSLLLIDGDIFLPGNLERHALDWRDVGYRKVDALQRKLLQIAPGARITTITENLDWQRSAKTAASQFDAIAASDVIVDATGDSGVSLTLGALAAANERAFISVEVFEGGIGALIASCLPERDPPFVLARATFLEWCRQKGVTSPAPGPKRYEALAEDGEPLVADDAAIAMTAGHAARVILDVLDGKLADRAAAWLLFGFRKEWVFNLGHGECIAIDVGQPPPSVDTRDAEAEAFAIELLKQVKGAAKASS